MATVDYIAQLRQFTNEPSQDPFSDQDLLDILESFTSEDGVTDVNRSAADVWGRKAALLANLVNVTESGSSRSMSQLHANALKMAEFYAKGGVIGIQTVTDVGVTHVRRIERPLTQ